MLLLLQHCLELLKTVFRPGLENYVFIEAHVVGYLVIEELLAVSGPLELQAVLQNCPLVGNLAAVPQDRLDLRSEDKFQLPLGKPQG